jgi:15-cis-phytoene desaturase
MESMQNTQADVIIAGAGLAGLCCAFTLAQKGKKVLVLEAQPYPGGRTASWEEDGMKMESGLHKFLGIYRTLPNILQEAGIDTDAMLTWVDAMQIHIKDTHIHAFFGAAPYHHPLRTLMGVLGNNNLIPFMDKLRLLRMGIHGIIDCIRRPEELDSITIADYARKYHVSDLTLAQFLNVMTIGVLFLPAEEFSAYPVFSPIVEGLKRGMTMRIGAFNGGMTDVMINPLIEAIVKRGGEVRMKTSVTELIVENGCVAGVKTEHGEIRAMHTVLATALRPAQDIVKKSLPGNAWFEPMLSLKPLPSATVQMELNRPAMPADHTNFSDTALCCFGEQSRTTFRHVPGRFSVILYPAARFIQMDTEAIRKEVESEAGRIGLDIAGHITRIGTSHHPADFYTFAPDSEALRPRQKTPVPGLSLAGDYTKQPFSCSMEGAAISGVRAAEAVLNG